MHVETNTFLNLSAHFCGWVPFVAVWTVLTSQFMWSLSSAKHIPFAVKMIPLTQLVLFALFGVNQMLGSLRLVDVHTEESMQAPSMDEKVVEKPRKSFRWSYIHAEVAYTVLSLVAKTILAYLLLGGTINQNPSRLQLTSLC